MSILQHNPWKFASGIFWVWHKKMNYISSISGRKRVYALMGYLVGIEICKDNLLIAYSAYAGELSYIVSQVIHSVLFCCYEQIG